MSRLERTTATWASRRLRSARCVFVVVIGAVLFVGCGGPPEDRNKEGHDCASCHLADYREVRDPPHEGAKPTTCWVCHSQSAWAPSVVHHEWPLDGAHADAKCFDCHRDRPPVFDGLGAECVDCHRDRYDANPLPWHASFPTTCVDCHSTTAWKPALHRPEPPPEPVRAEPPQTTPEDGGVETTPHRARRARRARPVPVETRPVDSVSGASRRLR